MLRMVTRRVKSLVAWMLAGVVVVLLGLGLLTLVTVL